ncbi:hypothetical protein, partial [Citrobacter youngae]|uniref:hypothetical protein n=1 Tax=Citrobacter youngae TaxID=133448 RepID=UPI001952C50B
SVLSSIALAMGSGYWLPFYIERTEINGQYLSAAKAGELSVIFDLGGIVGGILAGYISISLE